tara:strand:- start:2498 stop:3796 length:1299 start_codon:yes stop_codon:yes gene_type:complete
MCRDEPVVESDPCCPAPYDTYRQISRYGPDAGYCCYVGMGAGCSQVTWRLLDYEYDCSSGAFTVEVENCPWFFLSGGAISLPAYPSFDRFPKLFGMNANVSSNLTVSLEGGGTDPQASPCNYTSYNDPVVAIGGAPPNAYTHGACIVNLKWEGTTTPPTKANCGRVCDCSIGTGSSPRKVCRNVYGAQYGWPLEDCGYEACGWFFGMLPGSQDIDYYQPFVDFEPGPIPPETSPDPPDPFYATCMSPRFRTAHTRTGRFTCGIEAAEWAYIHWNFTSAEICDPDVECGGSSIGRNLLELPISSAFCQQGCQDAMGSSNEGGTGPGGGFGQWPPEAYSSNRVEDFFVLSSYGEQLNKKRSTGSISSNRMSKAKRTDCDQGSCVWECVQDGDQTSYSLLLDDSDCLSKNQPCGCGDTGPCGPCNPGDIIFTECI